MDPRLKRLGRQLAESQLPDLRAFDLDAQRSRFLLHAFSAQQRTGRVTATRVSFAAVAVAALTLLALSLHATPLEFAVAGSPGREGEWIAAPSSAALPLAFADGSQISLHASARARVTDSNERGAHIVLERGMLNARVVHRLDTSWRVDAGPFEVYVVGTHFDVAWDEERFELVLHEGAVRVVGPTLPQGRVISAGERLDITLGLVPSVLSLPPAPALQQLAVPAPTVSSLAQAPAPPALAPTATNWRKFALAGAHDRAWSLLTNESFAGLVRGAGPADLALAADVARFTRHPAEAARALEALRMRFPSYAQASDAAFLLGRLSFDQRSAVAEAARWFSTYVAERPNGAFAREARGRLIECYERLTALPQARSAAEDYLARYPAGPHEAIARAVLAKTNPDRGESN